MNVDICDDSRRVISMSWISGEYGPVRMIGNTYKFFPFRAVQAWNRSYTGPRWLLDEYYVKKELCFDNSIDDKIFLMNILKKDMNVL